MANSDPGAASRQRRRNRRGIPPTPGKGGTRAHHAGADLRARDRPAGWHGITSGLHNLGHAQGGTDGRATGTDERQRGNNPHRGTAHLPARTEHRCPTRTYRRAVQRHHWRHPSTDSLDAHHRPDHARRSPGRTGSAQHQAARMEGGQRRRGDHLRPRRDQPDHHLSAPGTPARRSRCTRRPRHADPLQGSRTARHPAPAVGGLRTGLAAVGVGDGDVQHHPRVDAQRGPEDRPGSQPGKGPCRCRPGRDLVGSQGPASRQRHSGQGSTRIRTSLAG
ncbi:Uncharacterised protein [Mycobacteroides abscessus subsp. bolletii]|nr:Uncharacterised protein [Mycobacteroides abscessus subsp. bolletii]